jgi:quinol monooxygenase YgiN
MGDASLLFRPDGGSMMGLALVVTHRVRPGHEQAFDALVQRTVESIRTMEPGTLVYATHASSDDPRQRIFYELYRDRAAFEAHEQYAHVRTFLADRLAHVESVEVQFLDVLSAHALGASIP